MRGADGGRGAEGAEGQRGRWGRGAEGQMGQRNILFEYSLQARAPGLQSTMRGHSIWTTKRLLRVKQQIIVGAPSSHRGSARVAGPPLLFQERRVTKLESEVFLQRDVDSGTTS